MSKAPRDVSPVNATLHAKIDAKIPPKSLGKLVEATARLVNSGAGAVEAITDLIRPFTEWTGLRGDRLRLQREEVALEIAKRAAAKVESNKKPLTPIPTKTVVRLLEGGSLEEPTDTTMIELWANLLASAAQDSNAATPRFISILEDLNGAQANTLQEIVLGKHQLNISTSDPKIVYTPPISEKEMLRSALGMSAAVCHHKIQVYMKSERESPIDSTLKFIRELLAKPGIAIESFAMGSSYSQDDHLDERVFKDVRTSNKLVNHEILASMGLLSKEKIGPFPMRGSAISLDATFSYLRITPLCISFLRAVTPDLVAWDAETMEQWIARNQADRPARTRKAAADQAKGSEPDNDPALAK